LIDQERGDAGAEDGDPEGELDALRAEQRVDPLTAIERQYGQQHWQQINDGPNEADPSQDQPEISGV